jgi:hypothetical protein
MDNERKPLIMTKYTRTISLTLLLILTLIGSIEYMKGVAQPQVYNGTSIMGCPIPMPGVQEQIGRETYVNGAIQALQNGNTCNALEALTKFRYSLGSDESNVLLLVDDAVQDLKNGNTNNAIVHLNLAKQQLPQSPILLCTPSQLTGNSNPDNSTSNADNGPIAGGKAAMRAAPGAPCQ